MPPGTPQHNGVSERCNRTLLDMVRSMMSFTDLPLSFWGYALETVAFTLNRAPSKSVEMTPYELWFSKKPKLSFLKVWGCDAYVKKLQPDMLKPKSEKCVFIGYLMTHKYRRSIVVLSISKSVEPNEEQKEMISGFQQGILWKH